MSRLPGALFVVDAKKERIAVAEANKLGIPVVAIVDTNADPDVITVPIAGNDDAIRSVSLISGAIADAIGEARARMPAREEAEESDFAAYSTDAGATEGGESEAEKRRRRPRRKRRPKPEAIVARIKTDEAAPAAPRRALGGGRGRPRRSGGARRSWSTAASARSGGRRFLQVNPGGDHDGYNGEHQREGRGRAAPAHRRRHDGLQEGADRDGRRLRQGHRVAARPRRRAGRQARRAHGQAGPGGVATCTTAASWGCCSELNCETDFVARTDDFKQLARDVAMHIAASAPLAVSAEDLPADVVERERRIYTEQVAQEGKPEAIRAKIVEGKLKKFYSEAVLLDQPYVKDDSRTVGDVVKELSGKTGEKVVVRRFVRYQLGEDV